MRRELLWPYRMETQILQIMSHLTEANRLSQRTSKVDKVMYNNQAK